MREHSRPLSLLTPLPSTPSDTHTHIIELCQSLSLFASLLLFLSISISVCRYLFLTHSDSIFLSISLSVSLPLSLSLSISFCLSFSQILFRCFSHMKYQSISVIPFLSFYYSQITFSLLWDAKNISIEKKRQIQKLHLQAKKNKNIFIEIIKRWRLFEISFSWNQSYKTSNYVKVYKMSFSHLFLHWKGRLCYSDTLLWKNNKKFAIFVGLTPVIAFLANRRQLDYQYCFDNPPVTTNMLLLLLFLILLLLLLLILLFLFCSAVRK